ncbi:MAG: NAD(P)/FAD-dependent oxidoreductase [Pirellulaceae bacterium]
MTHRVVVVGGGFGGVAATNALRSSNVQVTLVDRRNFHLFQPLLYQVATGQLSPANIAMPLRSIFRRRGNVDVVMGEVVAVDPDKQRVVLADGELAYDSLILAAGARHHYFGNDRFEAFAPGLKSLEEATDIRRRILSAFEAAERLSDHREISQRLTFVVVGGGPTGVELAGAIAELAHSTLRREFHHFNTASARVLLVEHNDLVLRMFPEELSVKAAAALKRLGVTVRTGTAVADVTQDEVTLRTGDEVETVETQNVFWAAGVQASPLGMLVARAADAETDRAGRLVVEADCSLAKYGNIYAIGDMANYSHGEERPLPGVAPVAMQQAKHVADCILRKLRGEPPRVFKYKDPGSMATIGRSAAVVSVGKIKMSGFFAWLAWLFLHLLMLVGFENRALVLMQWYIGYLTRSRSARLITHSDAALLEHAKRERSVAADSIETTSGLAAHHFQPGTQPIGEPDK